MTHFAKIFFWMFMVDLCFGFGDIFAQTVLDFELVRVGDVQRDTLLIPNEDLMDLMISNVSVSNETIVLPPAPFSGALSRILPGNSGILPVGFSPPDTGKFVGQVQVETDRGMQIWTVEGIGATEVVVINEVLADPASGDAGDANGDGVRNSNEDEFVEIYNRGKFPIAMGGWYLSDEGTALDQQFQFPQSTWINPGEYIVLFGGGNPTEFAGQVFVDDGRIGGGLRNSGDQVFLINPTVKDTLARMDYGAEGGKNVSLVRWPESSGSWIAHDEFPGKDLPFSPGMARIVIHALAFSPQDTSIDLNAEFSVSVQGIYSDGEMISLTDDAVLWSVSDSLVLVEEAQHTWRGNAPGQVWVYAALSDGIVDSFGVTVLAPQLAAIFAEPEDTLLLVGDTVAIGVTGTLSDGQQQILAQGYTVAAEDGETVAVQDGQVTGLAAGRPEIAVHFQDLTDSFSIRIADKGDLDASGHHDLVDAVRTVQLILGIPPEGTPFERRAADVNGDDVLDIRDLIHIIALAIGAPVQVGKPIVAKRGFWITTQEGFGFGLPHPVIALTFSVLEASDKMRLANGLGSLYVHSGLDGVTRGMVVSFDGNPLIQPGDTLQVSGTGTLVSAHAWTADGQEIAILNADASKMGLTLTCFPNPFNPATVLGYHVPMQQRIVLQIYSPVGQVVKTLVDEMREPGHYETVWQGQDEAGRQVGSGVYLAHLQGPGAASTVKLIVLR